MKKIKYFALVLVLMLGLIGGAYAWWTDTLEIDGTVATGNMNVEWYQAEDQYNGTEGYTTVIADIIGDGNKTVFIEIENLFPVPNAVSRVEFVAGLENMSTIPVKLDDLQVVLDGLTEDENLLYTIQISHYKEDGYWHTLFSTFPFNVTSLTNLEDNLKTVLDDTTLMPNEKLFFRVGIWLSSDAGNELIDQPGTILIELDWIQWNAP